MSRRTLSSPQTLHVEFAVRASEVHANAWPEVFDVLDDVLEERLGVEIKDDSSHVTIDSDVERGARIAATLKASGRLTLSNGRDDHSSFRSLVLTALAPRGPGAGPLVSIQLKLPAADAGRVQQILAEVGEAGRADWGVFAPPMAFLVLCRDLGRLSFASNAAEGEISRVPPVGIPPGRQMQVVLQGTIPLPPYIGWLNYWGPEVCMALSFPDHGMDRRRAQPTRRGAWLLRLTDAPLDLTLEDHRAALATAYSRFAAIGAAPTPRGVKTDGPA